MRRDKIRYDPSYNVVLLCFIAELEDLPKNDKEGIGCINRKRCINKSMICTVTGWVIAESVVNEHKCCQLPKKSNKCKDVEVEKLLGAFQVSKVHTHRKPI